MLDYSNLAARDIPANRQVALPSASGIRRGQAGLFTLNLCNDSDQDVQVSAIYLAGGGYPTAADKIRPGFTIPARGWHTIQPISMGEGYALYVRASGDITAQLIGKIDAVQPTPTGPEPIRVEDLMDEVALDMVMTTPESLLPGFSRAGRARCYDCNGIMRVAEADEPRFDHDPATGEAKGLLIEVASTNLILHSEDFTNAVWNTYGTLSVTANNAIAPDGSATADLLTGLGGIANRIDNGARTVIGGGTYTLFAYVKGSGTAFAQMNSSGGVYIEQANSITLTSEWQLLSLTMTTNAGNTAVFPIFYGGSGTTEFHIWGAQLEPQSFASSYIKTEASTVTRSADVYPPLTDGWYDPSGGTIYVEAEFNDAQEYQTAYTLSDGTSQEQVRFIKWNNDRYRTNLIVTGGVSQTGGDTAISSYSVKAALAFKENDVASALNGSIVGTDTTATMPTITQLNVGHTAPTAFFLNGHIKRIIYSKTRVPNATLEAITA